MPRIAPPIQPCLWFDGQAEQAARFYVSVFPDSHVGRSARYTEVGQAEHRQPPGSVMTVEFTLAGQPFLALNGGPIFKFTEAVSLMVLCQTQDEIDHYWNALSQGGDPAAQQCGWLKDRYGLSWQIAPAAFADWVHSPDAAAVARYMAVMMSMKKLDIAALQRAFEGR